MYPLKGRFVRFFHALLIREQIKSVIFPSSLARSGDALLSPRKRFNIADIVSQASVHLFLFILYKLIVHLRLEDTTQCGWENGVGKKSADCARKSLELA